MGKVVGMGLSLTHPFPVLNTPHPPLPPKKILTLSSVSYPHSPSSPSSSHPDHIPQPHSHPPSPHSPALSPSVPTLTSSPPPSPRLRAYTQTSLPPHHPHQLTRPYPDTGLECQYNGIVILTITTALEEAVEVREELDIWMDLGLYSRNLNRVCQWLSRRSVRNDFLVLRVVEAFTIVLGAWGDLNCTNQGYHYARCSWITSTGFATKADGEADQAAYALRVKKRQSLGTESTGRLW